MSDKPQVQDTSHASVKVQSEKADQVQAMFTSIAGRYDFLNSVLSFGVDKIWRNEAVQLAKSFKPGAILDVATGTADLAIALKKSLPEATVTGVDFAEKMLEYGREKAANQALEIPLLQGDGQNLAFDDNQFDLLTIAYGIRNFSDRKRGLNEFHRVLKPGGKLMVLEFPPPTKDLFGRLFSAYFLGLSPYIAGFISGERDAYRYLGESVLNFPRPDVFAGQINDAGFVNIRYKLQLFGISAIHVGEKP